VQCSLYLRATPSQGARPLTDFIASGQREHFHYELSGSCSGARDLSVRQVNPFKLRQFARASGVLAKSDPLDARMIASFVAIMPTRPAQRQAPAAARPVTEC
jgi:transposase